MNDTIIAHYLGFPFEFIFICLSFFMIGIYVWAGLHSSSRCQLKAWPLYRYIFWFFGVLCATATVVGPIAGRAHFDFVAHMVVHLLLGMLAPLFLVLSAPMTLFLRTLNVSIARRFTKLLKSWPVCVISHPVAASILNIGGLWVLYTTGMYTAMHEHYILHLAIHVHILLAGYIFTASMIYIDPTPHQFSFLYRTIVFILALAAHQILSKYIYAYPPIGVPQPEAETGGMIMYYGGDAIDLVIIFILFFQWYHATNPHKKVKRKFNLIIN